MIFYPSLSFRIFYFCFRGRPICGSELLINDNVATHFLLNFPFYFKINLDKTSEKVTKDPKRVEAARKDREKCMNKLKESILNDVKKR